MRIITNALIGAFVLLAAPAVQAGTVSVAVASNFADTAHLLAVSFRVSTGHSVRISAGSSGKLYAQIVNGAPFDVFLSADAARPERLEARQLSVPGSRFSYASGQLVLWSARGDYAGRDCLALLKSLAFDHLAIANPDTAPYGAAARQWLVQLGLWDKVRPKLVTGENISQALHFTASQNAALGLVAAAQLIDDRIPPGSCRFDVPPSGHQPILQQGVLLQRAGGNETARLFIAYLRSPESAAIISRRGYRLP